MARPRSTPLCAFGSRLNARATSMGLSVDDIAVAAGMSRRTVYDVLSGASSPRLVDVEVWAQLLECDIAWLASGSKPSCGKRGPRRQRELSGFGQRFAAALQASHFKNRTEFLQVTGSMSHTTLWRWETGSGDTPPSLEMVLWIANKLGCDPVWLGGRRAETTIQGFLNRTAWVPEPQSRDSALEVDATLAEAEATGTRGDA